MYANKANDGDEAFQLTPLDTKEEIISGILSGKGIISRDPIESKTVAAMKQALDEWGITYPSNATKQQLIDILVENGKVARD